MENIVRIKGINVDLCLFRIDDEAINTYTRWLADESINKWIGQHTNVIEPRDESEWTKRPISNNVKRFNIVDRHTNKLIGNCDATVDKYSRNACLGILIGEKSGRDKGYGTEVIKLLVKYCFEQLNMHNVYLQLNSDNKRALRCYEKAGFKLSVTEKEAAWTDGHWCDCLTMQILEQEYREMSDNYLDSVADKYINDLINGDSADEEEDSTVTETDVDTAVNVVNTDDDDMEHYWNNTHNVGGMD